jgi:hypothetical protein
LKACASFNEEFPRILFFYTSVKFSELEKVWLSSLGKALGM